MYGYGYGYNIARQSSASEDTFHPLDLAGTQLYFAKNTATPNLWNDQSPNGYDLTQSTAIQQPTISANSVDFDGVNDFMNRSVVSPFISDTIGVIYFSGLFQTGIRSFFFTHALNTDNNIFFAIEIIFDKIRVIIRNNTFTINNMILSDNTFLSGYIYGYIKSNGSNYELMVNGSVQPFTMYSGVDDGTWIGDIGTLNRLSVGSLQNLSKSYRNSKVNKIYYNNTNLSATNLTKLNTFFSDPNNY